MKKKIPKGKARSDLDIRYLESRLQSSLRPVSPRPDFVHGLRQQLTNQFDRLPALSLLSRSNVLLISIAVLSCVFLVIFLSIRAAITLISAFSLLYQYRRQAREGSSYRLNSRN